jgi:hypothetical protein
MTLLLCAGDLPEAPRGFEPRNEGFADLSLIHSGTAPYYTPGLFVHIEFLSR